MAAALLEGSLVGRNVVMLDHLQLIDVGLLIAAAHAPHLLQRSEAAPAAAVLGGGGGGGGGGGLRRVSRSLSSLYAAGGRGLEGDEAGRPRTAVARRPSQQCHSIIEALTDTPLPPHCPPAAPSGGGDAWGGLHGAWGSADSLWGCADSLREWVPAPARPEARGPSDLLPPEEGGKKEEDPPQRGVLLQGPAPLSTLLREAHVR